MIEQIWQAIISGLAQGSVYALIAQGFFLTWVTTKSLNFGQGEFLMIGAMFGLSFFGYLGVAGLSPFLAGLLSIAATVVLGLALERVAVRPVIHLASFSWVLSTVAVSIMLKNVAVLAWGPAETKFPAYVSEKMIHISGAGIAPQEVFCLLASVATMLTLFLFLKRARLGKAMMAVANNALAASVVGINPTYIMALAYALSSGLAGLGGILIAPITFAFAEMGALITIKAFAAALVGGLDNPLGILLGGWIIGLIEQGATIVSSDIRDLSIFVFVLFLLAIRPTGLMGVKAIEKV
jgi:branched-chain amino acid transport system permease protein